jgi:hypothetical protein
MPITFRDRGDISMIALLQEVSDLAAGSEIPIADIEAYLRAHPELVESWLGYSQDQRCSPSWYLAEPGAGLDGKDGWRVGYFSLKKRETERVFSDEFAACAFFIARQVEQLSRAG